MLLVILGAGASFDSVDIINARILSGVVSAFQPPLANGLFDSRPVFNDAIQRYGLQDIVGELRQAATRNEDIEELLEEMLEDGKVMPRKLEQVAALRFYLRKIIKATTDNWYSASNGVTNYASLVSRVELWRRKHVEKVAYITFNYDTMLEKAISQILEKSFDNSDDSLDAYVSDENTKLFKVHGSVDWAEIFLPQHPIKDGEDAENIMIKQFATRQPDNTNLLYKPTAIDNPVDKEHHIYFPAIAAPLKTKSGFILPPNHLEQLQSSLKSATRLLIIGWRGNESHFINEWKNNLSIPENVLVACGSSDNAADVTNKLRSFGEFQNLVQFNGGFTQLFNSNALRNYLN